MRGFVEYNLFIFGFIFALRTMGLLSNPSTLI
jgi:hypothetical protein